MTYVAQQVAEQEATVRWSNAEEFRDAEVPAYRHYIGVTTPGFINELTANERAAVMVMFSMKVQKGDCFYAFKLWRKDVDEIVNIFVCDNGELGFTAMLAREY
jgi:hypothetical protein